MDTIGYRLRPMMVIPFPLDYLFSLFIELSEIWKSCDDNDENFIFTRMKRKHLCYDK